jgi:hypothetical protein
VRRAVLGERSIHVAFQYFEEHRKLDPRAREGETIAGATGGIGALSRVGDQRVGVGKSGRCRCFAR